MHGWRASDLRMAPAFISAIFRVCLICASPVFPYLAQGAPSYP